MGLPVPVGPWLGGPDALDGTGAVAVMYREMRPFPFPGQILVRSTPIEAFRQHDRASGWAVEGV